MPRRRPPAAGKGRKKGSPNKVTRAFKEAVLLAYERTGGTEAFATWARENRTEFYKICARLIPHEVVGNPEQPPVVVRFVGL